MVTGNVYEHSLRGFILFFFCFVIYNFIACFTQYISHNIHMLQVFLPISHGNREGYLCDAIRSVLRTLWSILVNWVSMEEKNLIFVCNKRANESKTSRSSFLVVGVKFAGCVRCTVHIAHRMLNDFLSLHKQIILFADLSKCFMKFMSPYLMRSFQFFFRCSTSEPHKIRRQKQNNL